MPFWIGNKKICSSSPYGGFESATVTEKTVVTNQPETEGAPADQQAAPEAAEQPTNPEAAQDVTNQAEGQLFPDTPIQSQ
jgi:hypothetical protein